MRHALLLALLLAAAPAAAQRMRPADVDKLPSSPPTLTEAYGSAPAQVGDLRLPAGAGPHPVVIIIHGGCWWKGYAERKNTAALASRLTERGFATWNIEYRQLGEDGPDGKNGGDAGAGWPGTFQDWAAATDHLRALAKRYPLDLSRVAATGHSAGAHAALWVASRHKLPKDSEIASPDPLKIGAAVAIDGPPEPGLEREAFEKGCGVPAVTRLFGGTPAQQPRRYAEGSPQALLPLGVKSGVISASLFLSPGAATKWVTEARAGKDIASALIVDGTGHHDTIAPGSPVWPQIEAFLVEQLKVSP
ncbi:alpha/beta hydrolase family protein [Sandarakinorhabdus sp.]|uniref:alpha/beta hydrolase family protein n=1 Tax=Sandarakinorhabdus sp. TaxID=1916663 RepID=UPI003F713265